jgi:hypothetical protein
MIHERRRGGTGSGLLHWPQNHAILAAVTAQNIVTTKGIG